MKGVIHFTCLTILFITLFTFRSLIICAQSKTLDLSFGDNGKVITNLDSNAGIYAIALQSDQKIIAVGFIGSSLGIVRYNPNGRLDSSFGVNGVSETNIDTGTYTRSLSGRAVVIQKDRKIVIAGASYGNPTEAFVARYLPTGIIDSTFGINGITLATIANNDDQLFSVVLEDDQKIIACGLSYIRQSPYLPSLSVFRFNTNGKIDSTFGSNGSTAIDFVQDGFSEGYDVELQSGKILVTGWGGAGQGNVVLARFKEDGSLDSSFGTHGKVMQDFGTNAVAYYARIGKNGSITACGDVSSSSFTDYNFLLCRFKANGQLDSSFGNNGKQITDFYGGNDIAHSLAFQRDSNIVVCGTTANADEIINISTIRYNYNGHIDSTFGNNGFITFDTSVKNSGASVVIQPDDKILVGGTIGDVQGNFIILRYLNSQVLATKFLSFTLNRIDKVVQLLWQTSSEVNTSYFNIQRSIDGVHFNIINKTTAAGNSASTKNYTYTDVNAEALHSSKLYYRLQEVDKDGKSTYSNIQVINFTGNNALFIISPNPAKDHITITSSAAVSDAQITITSANGRTLYSSKYSFANGEQLNVPVSSFANQTLFITIISNNGKQEFKVVKE